MEGINPSEKNDWKKFERNNVTLALNVFYAEKEKIYPVYVSRHNSNRYPFDDSKRRRMALY